MASIIKVDTIQSTTANVFFQNSSGTEYARFDSGGNLGIGTTTPGAKLDVRGSSTFLINAANPTAWVSSDSTLVTQSMYMQVNTTSSDTRLGSYTNHPLLFLTNNSERMRIDSSGNVGIGTSSPATLLHVSSATGSATPTPTEIRVATTTSATDWSTTSPWGRLSFYSADLTDTGPKIQGALDFVSDTSGGGRGSIVFSSAAATTGTLTERMRIDSSGNLKFDSGYGSVATAYGCRAWVNFNGTGTVAIRASGNVSSITDNSTGNYTVNFTTAMPDVNFCAVASGFRSAGNEACISTDTYAVGSIIINCTGGTGTEGDFSIVNVSIFR